MTIAERSNTKALTTACGAHVVHDGMHDTIFVLLPLWAEAFGLSYAQVGLLKSAFSGALAVFQMPAGLLSERIGERQLLAGGTVLAGGGYALLGQAQGFASLFAIIVMIGIASAVQHPLGSAIISKNYSAGGRRAALGVYNFSGDVGKVAAVLAVGSAATIVGWQSSTFALGIVVIGVGIAVYFALSAMPVVDDGVQAVRSADAGTTTQAGWGFSDLRGYSLLSGVHILDSACRTGVLTFLPFVLMGKGASAATVGLAVALIFAGGAAGKLICGLLGARFGILKTVMVTEIATAALILIAGFAPLSISLLVLPFLGIALNGTSSVLYGTVGEFVADDRQARAFGLFYTIGSCASTVSPILFGILSDVAGLQISIITLGVLAFLIAPLSLCLKAHIVEN